MKEIVDLYDLMLEQLRDLYNGEQQQLQALPEFAEMADAYKLTELIEHHIKETRHQETRLQRVFSIIDEDPAGEECDGIKGLIKEAYKLAHRCENPEPFDAGLISSIQHINHYEMAGYGTAIAYAKALERHDIAEILLETLREEKKADEELSDLAEAKINVDATWTSLVGKAEKTQ